MQTISVIMLTYNCAEYLQSSVTSILNQTYKDFELFIIDDGSTDDTESVIKSFSDDRLRYTKLAHGGRSKALNYGLKVCANDWVALMDADDLWDPEKLEKQVNKFSFRYNAVSCTWVAYFADDKIKFTVDTPLSKIEIKEKLLLHSYICNPSVIYNRKFILANGGYDEDLMVFEDYELWLRLLNKIEFEVIPEYLIFMRFRNSSMSYVGLQKNKSLVLSIQNKYFRVGKDIFGVKKYYENELNGWREYFYGVKRRARTCWGSQPKTILNMRVMLAFVFTFFPERVLDILTRSQVRYRIKLLISSDYSQLQKRFELVASSISKTFAGI